MNTGPSTVGGWRRPETVRWNGAVVRRPRSPVRAMLPVFILLYVGMLTAAAAWHFGLPFPAPLLVAGFAFFATATLTEARTRRRPGASSGAGKLRFSDFGVMGTLVVLAAVTTFLNGGTSRSTESIENYRKLLTGVRPSLLISAIGAATTLLSFIALAHVISLVALDRAESGSSQLRPQIRRYLFFGVVVVPALSLTRGPLFLGILTFVLVNLTSSGRGRRELRVLGGIVLVVVALVTAVGLGMVRSRAEGSSSAPLVYFWAELSPVRSYTKTAGLEGISLAEGASSAILKPFPRALVPAKGFTPSEQIPRILDPDSFAAGYVEAVTGFGAPRALLGDVGTMGLFAFLGLAYATARRRSPLFRSVEDVLLLTVMYPMLRNGIDASLVPAALTLTYAFVRTRRQLRRNHPKVWQARVDS